MHDYPMPQTSVIYFINHIIQSVCLSLHWPIFLVEVIIVRVPAIYVVPPIHITSSWFIKPTKFNIQRNTEFPLNYKMISMKPQINKPTNQQIFGKPRKLGSMNKSTFKVWMSSFQDIWYCSKKIQFFLGKKTDA